MTYSLAGSLALSTGGMNLYCKVTEEVIWWYRSDSGGEYRFATINGGTLADLGSLQAASVGSLGKLIPINPGQLYGTEWVAMPSSFITDSTDKLCAITLNPAGPSATFTQSQSITTYTKSVTPIDTTPTTIHFSHILSNGSGASLISGLDSTTTTPTGTGSHTKTKRYQYLITWSASGSAVTFTGATKIAEWWQFTYAPDDDNDIYYTLSGWIPYTNMVIWKWVEHIDPSTTEDKFYFGTASSRGTGETAYYPDDIGVTPSADFESTASSSLLAGYPSISTNAFLKVDDTIATSEEHFFLFAGAGVKSEKLGLTFLPQNRPAREIACYPMGYQRFLLGLSLSTSDASPNNYSARIYITVFDMDADDTLCLTQVDYGGPLGSAGSTVQSVYEMQSGTEALVLYRDNDGPETYRLAHYTGLPGNNDPEPPAQNRLWIFKTTDNGENWANRGVALEPPPPEDSCIDEDWDG